MLLPTMPMRVRGKFATPRGVAVNACCCQFSLEHDLAVSVGIVLNKAECCCQSLGIPSGTSLCVKRKKLTVGKSE